MIYLEDKILALLIQLPPSMGIVEGMNGLRDIIPELDKRFRYAVEVRDSSWFQDLAYSFFANNNMCMVWSQLAGIRTPPIVTTDFLYIRFIGDRTIQEKDFGKIQKDRVSEMKKWARFLKRAREEHGYIHEVIPQERSSLAIQCRGVSGNVVPATQYGMSAEFPLEMLVTVTFEKLERRQSLSYPMLESQLVRIAMVLM